MLAGRRAAVYGCDVSLQAAKLPACPKVGVGSNVGSRCLQGRRVLCNVCCVLVVQGSRLGVGDTLSRYLPRTGEACHLRIQARALSTCFQNATSSIKRIFQEHKPKTIRTNQRYPSPLISQTLHHARVKQYVWPGEGSVQPQGTPHPAPAMHLSADQAKVHGEAAEQTSRKSRQR